MIEAIQQLVRAADALIARVYFSMFRERNALITFLFHSLFRDEEEIGRALIDPLQRTTVDQFRRLVEYYLDHGYRFVSPDDLLAGLGPEGKYALLTFDDGYYNNTLALPVLAEFGVPAVFFFSTDNVQRLGRFAPLGGGPIEPQCRTYRSDLLLYGLFRDGYLRLHRGGVPR